MRYRHSLWRDKLLLLSLIAFFYAYSHPIRVAVRAALEGQDFSWGYTSGVKADGSAAMPYGKGLFGHADYILISAFFVGWILCAGLRKPDRFFQAALIGWTSIQLGVALWLFARLGDSLTSNKDTLGVSAISYVWETLLPNFIAWVLAMALIIRSWRSDPGRTSAAWTRMNNAFLAGAAGFLLLGAILLNIGPQHGTADFNGVGMTYFALFLFLLGMSPWEQRDRAAS